MFGPQHVLDRPAFRRRDRLLLQEAVCDHREVGLGGALKLALRRSLPEEGDGQAEPSADIGDPLVCVPVFETGDHRPGQCPQVSVFHLVRHWTILAGPIDEPSREPTWRAHPRTGFWCGLPPHSVAIRLGPCVRDCDAGRGGLRLGGCGEEVVGGAVSEQGRSPILPCGHGHVAKCVPCSMCEVSTVLPCRTVITRPRSSTLRSATSRLAVPSNARRCRPRPAPWSGHGGRRRGPRRSEPPGQDIRCARLIIGDMCPFDEGEGLARTCGPNIGSGYRTSNQLRIAFLQAVRF